MKEYIKCLSAMLVGVMLLGCEKTDEYISKGYRADKTYVQLKAEYERDKNVKKSEDVTELLENMLIIADNSRELSWVIERLFEKLAQQDDYLSIVAYAEQIQTRALNHQLGGYVMYEQGRAYMQLSKNKWAEWMGVKHVYRNYDYLRRSQAVFTTLVKTYPHSVYTPKAQAALKEIKTELDRHGVQVRQFNDKIKQQR